MTDFTRNPPVFRLSPKFVITRIYGQEPIRDLSFVHLSLINLKGEKKIMMGFKSGDLLREETEALIIPVCEDKEIYDNRSVLSLIKKAKKIREFKGEKDDELIFHNPGEMNAERVIFVGMGKLEELDAEAFRSLAGKVVKKCVSKEIPDLLLVTPSPKKSRLTMADMLEPMMEGAFLGNHLFDKYKSEKKLKPMKRINFFTTVETMKKFTPLVSRISTICEGTLLAREWVSTPSAEKTPEQLANLIAEKARKAKLGVTVMKEKELRDKGFGAILAVGAGSQSPPCMVVLKYKAPKTKKTLVFVGKGITFDSGGINLKPGGSSKDMKIDMSGAAAVAAALITIAKLRPEINVVGLMPLAENMPSGSSYRPGDIIKTYEGKTVEIGNTDAEGRLILCDALAYGIKTYKPKTVIDLATLTGACVTALGDKIAGVFSSDDKLAGAIVQSGKKTNERCWHMPLPKDYKESLKSEIADTSNMADSNGGGAITAALFLSEFVGDTRWAHIDIAGTAFASKGNSYCNAGGTGFGVRLLCDLLEKL